MSTKKANWLLLAAAILPLALCLSPIENLILGNTATIEQKNNLFSAGVIGFLSIFTASISAYVAGHKNKIASYVATTDGKIHLVSFLAFAALVVIMHIGTLQMGDDVNYLWELNRCATADFMPVFYNKFSCTLVIHHFVFAFIVQNAWFWRVFDILVMLFGVECAIALALPREKRRFACVIYGLALLIPKLMFCDIGWCATTLNYAWPISATFFLMLMLKKELEGKITSRYLKTLSVFALLLACNCIQCSTCIFPLACIVLVYFIVQDGGWKSVEATMKRHRYLCTLVLLSLLCLLFNATCPGNGVRFSNSLFFYPGFEMLTLAEKLELGLVNLSSNIFAGRAGSPIYLPLAMVVIALQAKGEGRLNKALMAVNIVAAAMLIAVNPMRTLTYFDFPLADLLTNREINTPVWSNGAILAECLFYLAMVTSLSVSIFLNIKDKVSSVFIIMLVLASIESGLVMGFSPTIYTSGIRPLLVATICILFAAAFTLFVGAKEQVWSLKKHWVLIGVLAATAFTFRFGPKLEPIAEPKVEQIPVLPEMHPEFPEIAPGVKASNLHVDLVNYEAQTTPSTLRARKNSNATIHGYAFDVFSADALNNLYIAVGDSGEAIKVAYGAPRPDVQQTYALKTANVGFVAVVPTRMLKAKNGEPTKNLEFVMVGTDSTYKYTPVNLQLELE